MTTVSSKYIKDITSFYIGKTKDPYLYDYNEDGNLIKYNSKKNKEILQTIIVPSYRALTLDEKSTIEKERYELINEATQEYEDIRRQLHAENQNPNKSINKILELNQNASNADYKLYMLRYPISYISHPEGIPVKMLNFNELLETRIEKYTVSMLENFPFTLQNYYVRTDSISDVNSDSNSDVNSDISNNEHNVDEQNVDEQNVDEQKVDDKAKPDNKINLTGVDLLKTLGNTLENTLEKVKSSLKPKSIKNIPKNIINAIPVTVEPVQVEPVPVSVPVPVRRIRQIIRKPQQVSVEPVQNNIQ